MQIREHQARANALLSKLDSAELAAVLPQSKLVTCNVGDVVHEARAPLDHAYFPLRGMISIFIVTKNARSIETGFLSPSGALCHPHEDRNDIQVRLVANTAGAMLKMPLRMVVLTMQQNHAFRDSVICYQNRMIYLSHLATACVALHSLRERVCLWLLRAAAHSSHAKIVATQYRIAQHLGVDRTRVNGVLQELLKLEIVALPRRGEIWIRDNARLRDLACECQQHIAAASESPISTSNQPRDPPSRDTKCL